MSLSLIRLGQAAGFTLAELRARVDTSGDPLGGKRVRHGKCTGAQSDDVADLREDLSATSLGAAQPRAGSLSILSQREGLFARPTRFRELLRALA